MGPRAMLAAVAMLVAATAVAGERTYAAMSLVGDGLLVVRHRGTTGTSLEGNLREFLSVPDPTLDRAALLAVDEAVRRADPSARVVLLGGRDPAAIEAQSRTLGSDGAAQAIVDALLPRLPKTGATHLILATKKRQEARFDLADGHFGSGQVEGLGFYVDSTLLTHQQGEGGYAVGLLAPFAYLDVVEVDMATGKVVAERPVKVSRTYSERKSATLDPWDALSSNEKMRVLGELVRSGTARAVESLLAP